MSFTFSNQADCIALGTAFRNTDPLSLLEVLSILKNNTSWISIYFYRFWRAWGVIGMRLLQGRTRVRGSAWCQRVSTQRQEVVLRTAHNDLRRRGFPKLGHFPRNRWHRTLSNENHNTCTATWRHRSPNSTTSLIPFKGTLKHKCCHAIIVVETY